MKDLMDCCSKHDYELVFSCYKDKIFFKIYDSNWMTVYYIEGKKNAYFRLIRELKTQINLRAICGEQSE